METLFFCLSRRLRRRKKREKGFGGDTPHPGRRASRPPAPSAVAGWEEKYLGTPQTPAGGLAALLHLPLLLGGVGLGEAGGPAGIVDEEGFVGFDAFSCGGLCYLG
ncbi:hypothetical protein KDAU_17710 [Dictyobacter aurantiacus]|uniref:Uncharacterized protein n=1 Tax=Dictyobacter aurantiacus TaxID=1936993 RepID=A0A401ZC80_9CHLR|nr:hypothetical protein KDAU_17710 [Dictyobacter aurantiacus]